MPIFVKDYEWHETNRNIQVTIPLKGTNPKNISVYSTDTYLKISYPPFILEIFLLHEVINDKSRTIIYNGVIHIILEKKVHELWHSLNDTNIGKSEQEQKKVEAEKEMQKMFLQQENSKNAMKSEQKTFSVQQQMELEANKKEKIKNEKDKERQKLNEKIKNWKIKSDKERFEPKSNGKQTPMLPPPRKSGTISVTFSERVFPTAARESQAEEEQKWLRKQAKAQETLEMAYNNKDLKPEERDPLWLKEKGDSFFKKGNYMAALNAFSHAIYFDCKLPSVFSNRAACHLKMGNLHKAISDCSKALELLTPPVESNAQSRIKAHIRRGTAFCGLELYVEGLQDYEAALKLDPTNEVLQKDVTHICQIIQNTL